jgi:hypothetical protein
MSSLQTIVAAYLAKPDRKRGVPLYLPAPKKVTVASKTPEERKKEIQDRIKATRLKVETLMHQLNNSATKPGTRQNLRKLKSNAEALLRSLQEKLSELSRFAQEYRAGLKGKALASAHPVMAALDEYDAAVDGFELQASAYQDQADALLQGASA